MAHAVIGRCPVCQDVLDVTQLHCRQCDTMGYEVRDESALSAEQRHTVLERLAAGEISSEEAIKMLRGK
jgi:hypothetical protein